jgi:hypothetical protein
MKYVRGAANEYGQSNGLHLNNNHILADVSIVMASTIPTPILVKIMKLKFIFRVDNCVTPYIRSIESSFYSLNFQNTCLLFGIS